MKGYSTANLWFGAAAKQQGIVVVLVTIAMIGLLAMAGLALDTGHLMLNKAKLQNSVDASALAAAKVADLTDDTALATLAAINVFTNNGDGSGNHEMKEAYDKGDLSLSVQFSNSLNPFISGSYDPANPAHDAYVRVRATNFTMDSWLVQIVGFNSKSVAASAVAGPSPALVEDAEVCDLAPVMLCGEAPTPAGCHEDPDVPCDPSPPGEAYGYQVGDIYPLKISADQDPYCAGTQETTPEACEGVQYGDPNFEDCQCLDEVGPGNFHAIRLNDESGANAYRDHLAGSSTGCIDIGDEPEIETEPGNMVGPTEQGLNTRFGAHCGPMQNTDQEYKEDTNTCADPYDFTAYPAEYLPDYRFEDYANNYACDAGQANVPSGDQGLPNTGHNADPGQDPTYFEPMRRVLQIPVGDCSAKSKQGGHLTMPLIGTACAFILQPMPGKGPDCKKPKPDGGNQSGQRSILFAEVIGDCRTGAGGYAGANPGSGPGPYIIQLYKDPDSGES